MSSQQDNKKANKLTNESNQEEKDQNNNNDQAQGPPGNPAPVPMRSQASSSGSSQIQSTHSTQPTVPSAATGPSASSAGASMVRLSHTGNPYIPAHLRRAISAAPGPGSGAAPSAQTVSTLGSSGSGKTPAAQSAASQSITTAPLAQPGTNTPSISSSLGGLSTASQASQTATPASSGAAIPSSGSGSTFTPPHLKGTSNPAPATTVTAGSGVTLLSPLASGSTNTSSGSHTQPAASQGGQDAAAQGQPSAAPSAATTGSRSGTGTSDSKNRPTFFDTGYAESTACGTSGKKISKVRVNQFEIQPNFLGSALYQYSITLPQLKGRDIKNSAVKRIMVQNILGNVSIRTANTDILFTDWNSCVTTKSPILSPRTDREATMDEDITVEISFANQSEREPLKLTAVLRRTADLKLSELFAYVQKKKSQDFNFSPWTDAFNTLVRHFAADITSPSNTISLRDKIFGIQNGPSLNNSGLHLRQGVFNSVRPVKNSLRVHVNTSTSAFITQDDLVNFLGKYIGKPYKHPFGTSAERQLAMREVRSITKQLQVRYKYDPPIDASSRSAVHQSGQQGRLKRINGYGKSATDQKFIIKEGATSKEISVEDYFNEKVFDKSYKLKYPQLPVVNVGG